MPALSILEDSLCRFGYDIEPKFGPFIIGDPQTQQFFVTINIDAQSQINRLVEDAAILITFKCSRKLRDKINA
jgi:hypothetical protein